MLGFRAYSVLGLLLATGLPLAAQLDPEGAQVLSYFPHLADGGAVTQRWTTALTFVNPHTSIPALAVVALYGDNGRPLALDFGSGRVSTFNFTVPPQGTVSYKTTGLSPTTVTGWAMVASSLPLQGVVQFGYSANGIPAQGVSSQATPASLRFRSPATASTGIAAANTNSTSITVNVTAFDASGATQGQNSFTVPPHGHQSFTLGTIIPSLPSSFRGSVLMSANDNPFVAWTLSSEAGVISSYPPGALNWPVSQYERIWKVYFKLINAADAYFGLNPLPTLVVDYSTGQINSYADPANNAVHIFMNLAELISDSESELAFVEGHEIGHIIQRQKGGQLQFVPTNGEEDADEYGVLLSLAAGYDPYGGAGALAKLAMASGQAGLVSQVFDSLMTDPHGSFNDRLSLMFSYMQMACSVPPGQALCEQYKSIFHPHLPSTAPLMVSPRR